MASTGAIKSWILNIYNIYIFIFYIYIYIFYINIYIYFFWLFFDQPVLWLDWEFIMPFPNPPNRSYQQLKKILKQTFAIHLFIWHCVWPGLGIKRTVWKRLFLMQVGVESWVLPNPCMCLFLLLNTVYPERQPVWHARPQDQLPVNVSDQFLRQ